MLLPRLIMFLNISLKDWWIHRESLEWFVWNESAFKMHSKLQLGVNSLLSILLHSVTPRQGLQIQNMHNLIVKYRYIYLPLSQMEKFTVRRIKFSGLFSTYSSYLPLLDCVTSYIRCIFTFGVGLMWKWNITVFSVPRFCAISRNVAEERCGENLSVWVWALEAGVESGERNEWCLLDGYGAVLSSSARFYYGYRSQHSITVRAFHHRSNVERVREDIGDEGQRSGS